VRTLRLLWIGWVVHFKIVSRSPFAIGVGATWPIVNATLAYFMYRAGGHPQTLLYASLGSAVAGIWSMSAIDASGAIQRPLAVVIVATSFACTGFGMLGAGLGLRWRDAIIAINLADAVLLIFCGVNIPIASLPAWMQATSEYLPVTHGLRAARRVADGVALGDVTGLVLAEVAIGAAYAAIGFAWIRYLEGAARRGATLENA
jgi:ABC-2 type transport system permease protein